MVLWCCTIHCAYSQGNGFGNIVGYMNHLGVFQQAYPQEKVYLHFDNTGYFKGEKIFFKAYVTRADNGKPTDISKVLYVEILNPSGDIVQKRKLHIEGGEANGDLDPDSIIGTGFYEIRAYTRYMLNFGRDAAFSRVFPIFKRPGKPGNYTNPTIDFLSYNRRLPEREFQTDSVSSADVSASGGRRASGYHVNIYPEGGDMVEGLPCTVAFTVTDKNHNPVSMVGEVTDAGGSTLSIIESDSDGRGIFHLQKATRGMQMVFYDESRHKLPFDMPEVVGEGLSLHVDATDGDDIRAVFHATRGVEGSLLGYTLMNGGKVFIADTITADKAFEVDFPRTTLHGGVNQLTVFNSEGRILAERLFFICPADTAARTVQVLCETESVSPCGNVKLKIHSQPFSKMSFSAMDASTLPNGPYGNINTYMLLSSDVRGYIPHPEYYFEADDATHRMAADTLMLINGWRRYDWKVMAGTEPWHESIQQIEDKLYVSGYLHSRKKALRRKPPISNVDLSVYLFNEQGETLKGKARTDSAGYYAFELPDVDGEWNMLIYTRRDDQLTDYTVGIDRRFAPEGRYIMPSETSMIPVLQPNLSFGDNTEGFDRVDSLEMRRESENQYVLPTATIRKKRWTDLTGSWYDESTGAYFATLYYDCDEAADQIADMGEDMPDVYEWLAGKNEFFNNEEPQESYFLHRLITESPYKPLSNEASSLGGMAEYVNKFNTLKSETENENSCKEALLFEGVIREGGAEDYDDDDPITQYISHPQDEGVFERDFHTTLTAMSPNLYYDGYTYKGKPIIWILNNQYAGVTGAATTRLHLSGDEIDRPMIESLMKIDMADKTFEYDDFRVLMPSMEDMPYLLSDAKSIYINEDYRTAYSMLYSSALAQQTPVCIFVYTHRFLKNLNEKGLRRTHFQGYNIPTKFQMEDYSLVPPAADDFRRTLYWAPSVVADENGDATVEFYNNSTCKDMYISVEGITQDGLFVNN